MDETRRCILRRPAAASASSPLPPSSSSSSPPPPPPPPPPSLRWAMLPPKKRFSMLLASSPTPPPAPAAPALDVEALAIPSPIPSPPPLVDEAEASAPPPPIVAEAPSDDDDDDMERSTAAPPDDDDAAPKPAAAARRVRKIVKKVVVKRIVPKGTLAARKAAAAAVGAASESGGEAPTDKPEGDRNGAVGNEQNLDEELAAADCNAAAAAVVQALGFESATDSDCADARLGLGEEMVDKRIEMSEGEEVVDNGVEMGEVGMPEWQKRMTTEVFVGGLHRDANEEDVRAAFAMAGDITEVRMIMDARTGKNKGYCFVHYRETAQAKKAIAEFGNVKIDDYFSPMRSHSRPRHGSSTYIAATSSYGVLPHAFAKSSSPYYHDSNRYPGPASYYGLTGLPISNQTRQANSRQVEQHHRSRLGKKCRGKKDDSFPTMMLASVDSLYAH